MRSRSETPAAVVLAGLGIAQALLTALAAATGGLQATIINAHRAFVIGLSVVVAGFLLALLAVIRKRSTKVTIMGSVGLCLIFLGIAGTVYTALGVPRIASSPTVDVEISTRPLMLHAIIEATGIKRTATFQIQAAGFDESQKNVFFEPEHAMFYHALLGADASGKITSRLEVPVPVGRYDAVGVDAWVGEERSPGACGYVPGKPVIGFQSIRHNLGCALVRLPDRLGRTG